MAHCVVKGVLIYPPYLLFAKYISLGCYKIIRYVLFLTVHDCASVDFHMYIVYMHASSILMDTKLRIT